MAGLLSRMFGRGKREQRNSLGFYGGLALSRWGFGGMPVSAREAEALSAVCACITLISNSIASLPAELVQDTASGTTDAPPTAPAWRIVQRPNPWQSWPAFMAWLTAQHLLYGNAVAWIRTDARGAVNGLIPVPWNWILPQVVGGADGPRLSYQIMQSTPDAVLLGLPAVGERLLDTECMHVRARSDYGLLGRSVFSRAAAPLSEGLEIQQTAQSTWRNGLRPSAILKAPAYLQPAQRERFNDTWMDKFAGSINAGRVPLVEGGWDLQQFSMSSVDAQFAEMRNFSVGEICRLFSVPEPMLLGSLHQISDMSTFTTAYAQNCLLPIVTSIEREFDYAVLPQGLHLVLDVAGLQRGSFSASVSAINALVQSGVLSANEAREALGWSEHGDPEADSLRVGSPPNYPADFAGAPSVAPKPGATGNEPALPSHNNAGRQGNGKVVLQ